MNPEDQLPNLDIKLTHHSGDLGLEDPVRLYDKSLAQAVGEKLLITPQTSESIDNLVENAQNEVFFPDDLLTDEELERQEINKLKAAENDNEHSSGFINLVNSTRGRVILGTVAVLTAGAAVFGFSGNSKSQSQDTTTQTSATATPSPAPSIKPSATPKPAPTPEVIPNTETIPESLKILETEPLDQFSREPVEKRLTYFSWLTRGNIKGYADQYAAISGDPVDIYPKTISVDNTVREINTITGYNLRFALSQTTPEDAQKAIIASLDEGNLSDAYPIWDTEIKSVTLPLDVRFLAVTQILASPNSVSSEGLQTDTSGKKYHDITWSGMGKTLAGQDVPQHGLSRAYYVKYIDYKGNEQATWLEK